MIKVIQEKIDHERDILYAVGLVETMCFTITYGDHYWHMMDDHLFYSWGKGMSKSDKWARTWEF